MSPQVRPVLDYFYIVKNINDEIISKVGRDEQRRLIDEGNEEATKSEKKPATSLLSAEPLCRKDTSEGRLIYKRSSLYKPKT